MANYKDIEQEQLIGYWAKKTYGVKARDFLNSPHWPDIKILLELRHEFDCEWTRIEHNNWSALWGMVAQKGYPLKGKHLRKLENITQGIIQRRQKQHAQRQRIKALRNPYKKEDHMMTTTGSSATYNSPWK